LERAGARPKRYPGNNRALLNFIYSAKAQLRRDCLFRDGNRREFMQAVSQLNASECEIFSLETSSALVAAIVTFRDGSLRRCYTTYFAARWAKYSPGIALLFYVTQKSLQEDLACDYMTGEQEYKLRLATGVFPLYQLRRIRLDRFFAQRELALAS
jgi:CelD/BcsL family acetyltransferase involved in cellulose biosynthesis